MISCLSNLERDPEEGFSFIYSKLSLNNVSLLQTIDITKYQKLKHVEITNCQISEFPEIEFLPHLTHLDLSGNRFRAVPKISSMKLTVLKMSRNQLMSTAGIPSSLLELSLDENLILKFEERQEMKNLIRLSLVSNGLRSLDGLSAPNLLHLDVSKNRIRSIDGLSELKMLRSLNLAQNHITDLAGFPHLRYLQSLDVSNNNLTDTSEFKFLSHLDSLQSVGTIGNSLKVTIKPNPLSLPLHKQSPSEEQLQRCSIISLLPFIQHLDGQDVSTLDRIEAERLFSPSSAFIEKQNELKFKLKQVSKCIRYIGLESKLFRKFIPLVLVGPAGSGKRTLTQRVLEEYPAFQFCPSHTTRFKRPGEKDGVDYNFVSREEMIRSISNGEDIQHVHFFEEIYAIMFKTLWKSVVEGKCPILDLEIEGLVELKQIEGIPIKTIFINAPSEKALRERLQDRSIKYKQKLEQQNEITKVTKLKQKQEHNQEVLRNYRFRVENNLVNVLPKLETAPVFIPSLERELSQLLTSSKRIEEKQSDELKEESTKWSTLDKNRDEMYQKYSNIPGYFDLTLVNDDLDITFDKVSKFINENWPNNK